jgi:hypothetical protein
LVAAASQKVQGAAGSTDEIANNVIAITLRGQSQQLLE